MEIIKMLVLSRRIGETLCIGDNIRITVLNISGNQVRVGIAAPADVPVHREEVKVRIDAEARGAGAETRADLLARKANIDAGRDVIHLRRRRPAAY